tara:strand:- start:501 stop:704 length:204 start_codon:yes stop_codon:yes gene_type:complete
MREPVEDVGIPPCDECDSHYHCATKYTACKDFVIYVQSGELIKIDRHPWRFVYNSIFRGNEGRYGWT